MTERDIGERQGVFHLAHAPAGKRLISLPAYDLWRNKSHDSINKPGREKRTQDRWAALNENRLNAQPVQMLGERREIHLPF